MSKPLRLGKRHAHLVAAVGSGWLPILYSAADRKLTDRLEQLGLAKRDKPHAGCWTLKLTDLGCGLAAAMVRARGGKLTRKGVSALALMRGEVFDRFNVAHAVESLEPLKLASPGDLSKEFPTGRRARG